MKIRLTIMTENDKHVDESVYSKEEVAYQTKIGWQALFDMFSIKSYGDRATIESVDVVEM